MNIPKSFHSNEIRAKKESSDFLVELKELLAKHRVNMIYGHSHIEFIRYGEKYSFAQTYAL